MNEPRKRTACKDCSRKHLTQAKLDLTKAQILMKEAFQGYPAHFEMVFERMADASEALWLAHDHWWDCMGHMAEAADEIVERCAATANAIRDERLQVQADPNYWPDFNGLRRRITLLEDPLRLDITPGSATVPQQARNSPDDGTAASPDLDDGQRQADAVDVP